MVKEVLNHEELQKELQKAGDMVVIVYLFDSGNLTGQYGKLQAISEMAMLAREHTNVLFLQVLFEIMNLIIQCYQLCDKISFREMPIIARNWQH